MSKQGTEMKRPGISRAGRRIGVILNYLSLIMLMVCFYLVNSYRPFSSQSTGISIGLLIAVGLAFFIIIIVSFIYVYMKTGLWRRTHTGYGNLDERQVQVNHEALRYAYGLFTILILLFLLVTELYRDYSPESYRMPLFPMIAAFLYLAHVLPGSILAWTEKEV